MNKGRRKFIEEVQGKLLDPINHDVKRVVKQRRPYTVVGILYRGTEGLGFSKLNPSSDDVWSPDEGVRIAEERAIISIWRQGKEEKLPLGRGPLDILGLSLARTLGLTGEEIFVAERLGAANLN